MASMYAVKTTVEISDALLARAKRQARRTGQPLRALIEEGLRSVLSQEQGRPSYRLPDLSQGDAQAKNPLEALSWQELRQAIYGEP